MLALLKSNGDRSANLSLTDISYGFEVCYTGQAGDVLGQPVQPHPLAGIRGGTSVLTCE